MKLKRRAAGLGGYVLGAGIFADLGLTWQIVLVGTALALLTYAYRDETPAKPREPREPRGWMATVTLHRWQIGDPVPETVQQRALPRPSTTPPMWAVDPTRTRRHRQTRKPR